MPAVNPFARRLLVLSPAWPAAGFCVWTATESRSPYWPTAAGLFTLVGLGSLAAARGWLPAGWLPWVWRAVAVPVGGWGLLMLPTCWFTAGGVMAVIAAALLIGYARDLSDSLAVGGRTCRERGRR